jgi:putative type I restriction modification DNA specificity domain protein
MHGKCAIAEGLTNGIGFGSSEFHTFRCHASEILTKFLFLLLNQTTVRKAAEDAMTGASGHRRVPAAFYEEMLIPVPPIPVQQQVIDECAKIDEEYNATRMSIETYRQKTADLFAELDAVMSTTEGNRLSLSDTEKFSVAIGKRVLDKELASNGTIPVYSANVTAPFGFIDKLLITDFSAPSVLWGIDGDWMTSYLPSDMPFYPTDHCGVLRCKNSEVNPRYLAHILEVEGRKMGFSRSYRASIDRVHGIAFTVPDISIQNNAMSKVADYEMAIKELEGSLEKIASRRSEIIRKALAE